MACNQHVHNCEEPIFTFWEKFWFSITVSLYLVWSILWFASFTKDSAQLVKEVWASFEKEPSIFYMKEKSPEEEMAAVLQRIAKCESGGKQFDSKGRLMKHVNKDGSVDFGKFMINDKHHEAKAASLGFNIYSEEGNEAYAKHLYATAGTEPWRASRPCWNK